MIGGGKAPPLSTAVKLEEEGEETHFPLSRDQLSEKLSQSVGRAVENNPEEKAIFRLLHTEAKFHRQVSQ
ncbi:uncharacterized protein V6R79_012625 [Siganus canaliculatus]